MPRPCGGTRGGEALSYERGTPVLLATFRGGATWMCEREREGGRERESVSRSHAQQSSAGGPRCIVGAAWSETSKEHECSCFQRTLYMYFHSTPRSFPLDGGSYRRGPRVPPQRRKSLGTTSQSRSPHHLLLPHPRHTHPGS